MLGTWFARMYCIAVGLYVLPGDTNIFQHGGDKVRANSKKIAITF